MTGTADISQWAVSLTHEHGTLSTVSRDFWASLGAAFDSYVKAANAAFGVHRLAIACCDDDAIIIRFHRFELRVHLDIRTARIIYLIADTRIKTLDPAATDILEHGDVNICACAIDASTCCTSDFKPLPDRPLPEQLVEYLLQRLVNPNFVDTRFN